MIFAFLACPGIRFDAEENFAMIRAATGEVAEWSKAALC